MKLERLTWKTAAATAHEVSTMPAFRTRFSAAVIRKGVKLRVGRVAILFADLSDSMRLYTEHGDAVAFRVVQDHFDAMRGVIEAHRGTIRATNRYAADGSKKVQGARFTVRLPVQ